MSCFSSADESYNDSSDRHHPAFRQLELDYVSTYIITLRWYDLVRLQKGMTLLVHRSSLILVGPSCLYSYSRRELQRT